MLFCYKLEHQNISKHDRKSCCPRVRSIYNVALASIKQQLKGGGDENGSGGKNSLVKFLIFVCVCVCEPADSTSLPQVISICLWKAPAVIWYLLTPKIRLRFHLTVCAGGSSGSFYLCKQF